MTEKRNLPTLAELIGDTDLAMKHNDLNVLLNQSPPEGWVKEHPYAKDAQGKKIKYIPIERIEWLLYRVFINWNVEIKSTQLIGNSVVVTIRLHYKDPITGQMQFQDGVGAMPLQTEKGSGAIEFDKLKSSAVQMAAPAAESYAIKDAAEKLGRLFGKDINRKGQIDYFGMNAETFSEAERIQLKKKLSDALDICQDQELRDEVLNEVLDAEADRTDTIEFYNSQIAKFS